MSEQMSLLVIEFDCCYQSTYVPRATRWLQHALGLHETWVAQESLPEYRLIGSHFHAWKVKTAEPILGISKTIIERMYACPTWFVNLLLSIPCSSCFAFHGTASAWVALSAAIDAVTSLGGRCTSRIRFPLLYALHTILILWSIWWYFVRSFQPFQNNKLLNNSNQSYLLTYIQLSFN